jgi:uncharacterized protein
MSSYSPFGSSKLNITKQEITLTVCEQCDLQCSYCYLPGKNSGRKMTLEVGKKAIDYFLKNPDFFNAPLLVLDFVGGEPLLEVELMDQIADYFKIEAYKMNHRWFDNYKLTFSTNGTHYRTEGVQKFVEKNKNCLFPSISLDGIEDKHNNARKYRNGKGSYKDVVESAKLMLKQLPYSTIKATFGRGDIKYFKDSFIHFLELGFLLENIFANVAYEDLWDDGDDILFEEQLTGLADYLIDNNICNSESYGNLFSDAIGKPYTDEHLNKHWCNTGHAVIVGVDGSFYPCIRFLEIAFHERKRARKIGDIHKGIDFDKLRPFRVLTLNNCSPKKCLQCDVASGCNMCSGQALDESDNVTIFYRPTYICKMHKARVRANEYFWKKLKKKENLNANKDTYARELRIPNKKILNILLSSDSPAICNYGLTINNDKNNPQLLNSDILEKFLHLAKEERYYVNFIYPHHEIGDSYKKLIAEHKFQVTRPYMKENSKSTLENREIFVFKMNQPIEPGFSCVNVILHMKKDELKFLENYVTKLFSNGIIRINLVIDDLSIWSDEDLRLYQEVLTGISKVIIVLLVKGQQRNLNVITDRLILDKMNNCNAGLEHITLGPDGKLYLCPAFYYKNQPLAQRKLQIPGELKRLLNLDNAPICSGCDAYQCRRCFFFNFLHTEELNIPGQKQCTISHIEREVSRMHQEKLIAKKMLPYPNRNLIVELKYTDPFEITRVW